MSRILIAGYGYVGAALGQRLAEEGHDVVGIRRYPSAAAMGVGIFAADVTRPETLRGVSESDSLVYCVGASEHTETAYRAAYVEGLRNVLACTTPRECNRVIFVSSTAVYGQTTGEWVNEGSPAEAPHFSGRLVREGELLALGSGIPSVVLRLGGIYGPGRTRLIETVRDGTATIAPGSPHYLNLNHVDDCVGAIRHLLFLPDPEPIYIGTDGHPEDRAVVLRWIAAQLGVPEPPVVADSLPSNRHSTNKRCRNDRLVQSGYTFAHPTFREGYGALLQR